MDLSKQKQLGRYGKKGRREPLPNVPDMPEAALQQQMDDMLDAMQIEYRRIPDRLWQWLQANCPSYIIKQLSAVWKSKPDTLMLIPISDKYSIAREVELKSRKGKLSTRQAKYAERMPVTVSRSTAENEAIVRETVEFAEKIKSEIE